MSKYKPILFSTPMMKAILDGRKTMTRRIAKVPHGDHFGTDIMDWELSEYPHISNGRIAYSVQTDVDDFSTVEMKQKYNIGDILWVRETFSESGQVGYYYKANYKIDSSVKWKPSIFMPKAACRIFLEITDVRVERLQEISEADAIAEGIDPIESFNSGEGISNMQMYRNYSKIGYTELLPKDSFQSLWQSINGNWGENPFVWVIEFKKIDKPKDFNP